MSNTSEPSEKSRAGRWGGVAAPPLLGLALAAFCFPVVRPVEHGFDIYFHGARTAGVVEDFAFRRSLTYTYSVGGHTYRGSSYGGSFHPIQVGGPIEVRYSLEHPDRSTAHPPSAFFGQLGIGVLLAIGSFWVASRAYRAFETRAA